MARPGLEQATRDGTMRPDLTKRGAIRGVYDGPLSVCTLFLTEAA